MLGGITKRGTLYRLVSAAALTFVLATGGQAEVQLRGDDDIHLGVASCAGNNCHGATERSEGSSVAQNEYLIWSKSDKHHRAYTVLLEERGQRIARNLGLANAATADRLRILRQFMISLLVGRCTHHACRAMWCDSKAFRSIS